MFNPEVPASPENVKERVILVPGITMFDRAYTHTKEALDAGGDLEGVDPKQVREKVLDAYEIVGDLAWEHVENNSPENRFVPDTGAESRLIAAGRLFQSNTSEQHTPDVYVTGGMETNTVEEGLFRSEIMKSHLIEKEKIPASSIINVTSPGNTKGNMESFLAIVGEKHDLRNTEVLVVTDERHLPRSTVMLLLGEYKRIHGKDLFVEPSFIQDKIQPILDKFLRYKDANKLTAEETSAELLTTLGEITGSLEISIIPKSSADVMEETAKSYGNPERDKRYADTLKGDPYNWPHREQEIQGIIDILSQAYKAGHAGSPGQK